MSTYYRAVMAGLEPGAGQLMWANEFLNEAQAQIGRAKVRGATHVEINSGELHRKVGGYPGKGHRMPICCKAMYFLVQPGDEVLMKPLKGYGASLTIRYRLPKGR